MAYDDEIWSLNRLATKLLNIYETTLIRKIRDLLAYAGRRKAENSMHYLIQ